VFAALIVIRLLAAGFALVRRFKTRPVSADELPVITLLTPLYREAEVLPDLIKAAEHPQWRRELAVGPVRDRVRDPLA